MVTVTVTNFNMWRLIIIHICVFSGLLFITVDAQKGLECLTDKDCKDPQQWCSFGYCRCHNGLQFERTCLNVANYSEPCVIDEQCQGLLCLEDPVDKEFKCLCDRFHAYNFTSGECYDKYTLEEMLAMIPTRYDSEDEIENAARKVFGFVIASGILVIVCGAICTISVIIFCCYMTYSDRKEENWIIAAELKMKERLKNKSNPTTTATTATTTANTDVEAANSSAVYMEPIIMTQPVVVVL